MIDITQLPEIEFCNCSAEDVEFVIIAGYEKTAERVLAPGDPVRLFLESIAAIIAQQRSLIDFAAKQNLLAYSSGECLDHLGSLLGVSRLKATASTTTFLFTLSDAKDSAVTIPAGTRISTGDVIFETIAVAMIPIGELSIEVAGLCQSSGAIGNGYLPGQISKLVDPLPYVSHVVNTTTSSGGGDVEEDDSFRNRIRQVPESFSTAGPVGGYKYWALTAHQDIVDVAVYTPSPGVVEIRPLMSNGELPLSEILDSVDEICNAETVRPLTDTVQVLAPEQVEYSLDLTYWIARSNATMVSQIQSAVEAAVAGYRTWQKEALGRDINPSELIARVQGAGALRCEVRTPLYASLEPWQVASDIDVAIVYGGFEDG